MWHKKDIGALAPVWSISMRHMDIGQYFKKADAMSIHVQSFYLMRRLFIAVLGLWLLLFLFWKTAKLAFQNHSSPLV